MLGASCTNAAAQEASWIEAHEGQVWLLNRTLLCQFVVSAQPLHFNVMTQACLGET